INMPFSKGIVNFRDQSHQIACLLETKEKAYRIKDIAKEPWMRDNVYIRRDFFYSLLLKKRCQLLFKATLPSGQEIRISQGKNSPGVIGKEETSSFSQLAQFVKAHSKTE